MKKLKTLSETIQFLNEAVNSLGLNNKAKKKFGNVDAVDNVSYIKFEDKEVERICHEHGVYTVDDAAKVTTLLTERNSNGEKISWFSDSSIKIFKEFKYFTGLKKLEDNTFEYCEYLTSIELPNKILSIGSFAFNECSLLIDIDIPNGVTTIENGAFLECKSIENVNIPNTVNIIEEYAFSGCENLQKINIPNNINFNRSIGECTFSHCISLLSINIPDGIIGIDAAAFYDCITLKSIKLPNTITYIKYNAFNGCSNLQYINIPNNANEIEEGAFDGCDSLKLFYISNNHPLRQQLQKEYPNIQLIEPKVNESSNLGLNTKVKKKFSE